MDVRGRGWHRILFFSSLSRSRVLVFQCWCCRGFCRCGCLCWCCSMWGMCFLFLRHLLLAVGVVVLEGRVPGEPWLRSFWRVRLLRRCPFLRCGGECSWTRRWRRAVIPVCWSTGRSSWRRRALEEGGPSGFWNVELRGGAWSVWSQGRLRGALGRRWSSVFQGWRASCCRRPVALNSRWGVVLALLRWRCRWRRWWGVARRSVLGRWGAWRWPKPVWRSERWRQRRCSR